MQTRWKVPLKSSKNQYYKCSVCFVHSAVSQYEYVLQFSGSTVGSEAHIGRASTPWSWYKCNIPKCTSSCWPLPCVPSIQFMPYIHLVTNRCNDAPFTGVLKNFRISAKNSGHGVNLGHFRTSFKISGISGQCPGLWRGPHLKRIFFSCFDVKNTASSLTHSITVVQTVYTRKCRTKVIHVNCS